MAEKTGRCVEAEKRMKEALREHCASEASRSHSEAKLLYEERLHSEINDRVVPPYCIPYVEGGRKQEWRWVKNSNVLVGKEFDFYHHSPEEVVGFAISHRGSSDFLLDEMRGLYLDEFPAPNGGDPVYMVSHNGNHRRLVYACIGLPHICAVVQESLTNQWCYYWRDDSHAIKKIIVWFLCLGLLDKDPLNEEGQTLIIEGKDNVAGWLLPDVHLRSVSSMLSEIEDRAEALNRRFHLEPDLLNLLRSKTRRRLSLEWSYLRYRFRKPA